MKGLRFRIGIVVSVVIFALYLLTPSILKFGFNQEIPKVPGPDSPWYYHYLPSQSLNLGLDLRGGVHLVLGIAFEEAYSDSARRLQSNLKDYIKDNKLEATIDIDAKDTITIAYPSSATWDQLDEYFNSNGIRLAQEYDILNQTENSIVLQLSELKKIQIRDRALQQSLETLRNRIDQFGIAEPIIQQHGEDKILVQFPGVTEISRIKDVISRAAKLTFNIVRSGNEVPGGPPSQQQVQTWVEQFIRDSKIKLTEERPITRYLTELNAALAEKLPKNTVVRFQKVTNVNTNTSTYLPYVLDSDPIVKGEEIEDAYVGFDEKNQPTVQFSLNLAGAARFERGTGENIKKHMAIVLDNNVHSAPVIQNRIPGGRAQITMNSATQSSAESAKDANDTALVLRSGALPARLEFLEERTIGPSLGLDAIRAGTQSLALGLFLVLLFMVIYYRVSGLYAVLALTLNALLILACLAAFEGTLTLPGLAGITLTVGMAVDANVLIFEHIREELLAGKLPNMAVAEGYRRAFSAILDSNLTTILAAVVLMSFGYGPIRGFAVTLIIGLVASMFTAVYVTRVVVDATVIAKGKKTISI